MKQGKLEKIEKLEQLRAVENGIKIKMVETDCDTIGIDTEKDHKRALEILKEKNFKTKIIQTRL